MRRLTAALLDGEKRTDPLPGTARLRELLAGYPASRGQQAVLRAALPAPAGSHSLEEAFARHRLLFGLRSDISVKQDKFNWRRDLNLRSGFEVLQP